jgi:1-deoxy-D-xylulose 5-phosphate reductoisomerase
VAVAAFLSGRIPWATIAEVVAGTLDSYQASRPSPAAGRTVEDVLEADAEARRRAELVVSGREAAA